MEDKYFKYCNLFSFMNFRLDIGYVHCSQCSIKLNPVGIEKFENVQYKWKENKPKKKSVR